MTNNTKVLKLLENKIMISNNKILNSFLTVTFLDHL